jgi:hypothetical protein
MSLPPRATAIAKGPDKILSTQSEPVKRAFRGKLEKVHSNFPFEDDRRVLRHNIWIQKARFGLH